MREDDVKVEQAPKTPLPEATRERLAKRFKHLKLMPDGTLRELEKAVPADMKQTKEAERAKGKGRG